MTTEDLRIQLGLRLKIMREERKLTQQQLADILGCNRSSVAIIETGKRNVSIDVLQPLLSALNCRLDIIKCEE